MWYELWDGDTGNRVGTYPTAEAVLRAVLEDIRLYGPDAPAIVSLGLLQRDPDHPHDRLIAEGDRLVERALALAATGNANDAATAKEPAEHVY